MNTSTFFASLTAVFALVFLGAPGCAAPEEGADEAEEMGETTSMVVSPKNPCFGLDGEVVSPEGSIIGGYWSFTLHNFCDTPQYVRVDIADFPDTRCITVDARSWRGVSSQQFHYQAPKVRGVVSC